MSLPLVSALAPSWEEVGFLPKNFPSTQKVHLPLRKKTGGALYSDFSERCEARQEAPPFTFCSPQ